MLYHLLLPVYVLLRTYLIAKLVLGADESPWRVMGKGRSAKWWTWALVGDTIKSLAGEPGSPQPSEEAAKQDLWRRFVKELGEDPKGGHALLEGDAPTQRIMV